MWFPSSRVNQSLNFKPRKFINFPSKTLDQLPPQAGKGRSSSSLPIPFRPLSVRDPVTMESVRHAPWKLYSSNGLALKVGRVDGTCYAPATADRSFAFT